MKNVYKILIIALAIIACGTTAQAQSTKQKGNHQRLTREQMAEKQANFIAHELAMDDATATRFVDTYRKYQQEMWSLRPQHKKDKDAESKTDAQAAQDMKQRFEHSQKLLDLRKKYYDEYSKFLTPKQIERVYDLEKRSMKHLKKKHNRTPKRPTTE